MSRYIVRCLDGNHLGYPSWDKVILNSFNGRTQLHDVFNKLRSKLITLKLNIQIKVITELSLRYPACSMVC